MSLQMDSFGNKGHYLNLSDNQPCPADLTTDHSKCYFDIEIKSQGIGGFGVPPHTLKQESGVGSKVMPDAIHPMWVHYDLQNTCDITDMSTCVDNTNCQINPKLTKGGTVPPRDYFAKLGDDQGDIKKYLLEGRINKQDPYWSDKNWSDKELAGQINTDVCDWDGIKCKTLHDSNKYITEINHSKDYFKLPGDSSMCQYKSSTPTQSKLDQNQWVQQQSQACNNLTNTLECSKNMFCGWKDQDKGCYDSNNVDAKRLNYNTEQQCSAANKDYVWKVHERVQGDSGTFKDGTCSLKGEYKVLSGLNKDDVFKRKTLSEVLGNINNGRVSDINMIDDVKVDRRVDVIMKSDNQQTAVKGLVEETALSQHFFSPENINSIQRTIRFRVYGKTNQVIDYQSPEELYIVMRSVLLQHGNFKVSGNNLLTELLDLNKHVTTYCVNEVSSNVIQYKGYLKDLESLPDPLDRPAFEESGSRRKGYDISNHIGIISETGWGTRHKQT